MYFYHRLWLPVVVLAMVTTSMCGFASEHDISVNDSLKNDSHLETQAASHKEMIDSELNDELSIELYRSLRFEPPHLDFGIWSVGTVRSHTVTLINHNRNRSVYLSSVSGKTSAFSSSFFEAKMVPPNGNTTFNVVFLPREQGAISTSLNIHTSFGKLRLSVRGVGCECPYRLKPLVGIRAPLNATIMPEIHMYNPHNEALQILEVYSSGGQFQLELPSGDAEAPKGLWEIPPLTTKPVIRIRFQGYSAGNYSAYIRIKIAKPHNSSDSIDGDEEQVLVIPVEFEILPHYGIYAVNPLLEFGHVAVGDNENKVLKRDINLRHSKNQLEVIDPKFENITSITGILVENHNVILLYPNNVNDSVVRLNEKLELQLKDNSAYTYHNVELIVRADIFKGSLYYDVNQTLFIIPINSSNKDTEDDENYKEEERLLSLRNDFQVPMSIYNVTINHNDTEKLSLQLKSFEMGMVLRPGHSFDLMLVYKLSKLQQQQGEEEDLKDHTNYKTAIYVYTNITNFEIPIVITSARLFVTTQTLTTWRSNTSVYTKDLHLGSIPIRETSHKGFVIFQNRNSIPIELNNLYIVKPKGIYYHLLFLGCIQAEDINQTNYYTIDLEKANYKLKSKLEEGEVAVYMMNLQPYSTEHNSIYLKVTTPHEHITISIKFSTALGKLEVDQEKLHFANCFPGKLCSSELSIRSTFKQPIHIKYINFTDSGLRFEDENPLGSKILPQSVTTVGRIFFQPSALCGSRCYIQQQTDELTTFPSSILVNSLNIPNFDEVELRRRTELYRHFKYYFQNMDFTMTTKEMQNFQLNLMIELEWPQLVNGHQTLPIIEVNETYIHEVKITNPSDNPILIDYTLADPTLAKQTRLSLPLEVVVTSPSCYLTDKAVFSFVNSPPKKPILIPGLSSVMIPIRFQADHVGTTCTLLHIRNNLTLYEGVWISAKTVQSEFHLGNRKPGSQTPLLFEISEQHLASACPVRDGRIQLDAAEQYAQPLVISRRVFTARNSGKLPMRIDGFWIGDQQCKGYGFEITDCSSFELKANSSKKIEISFQSDFTVTRIKRPLILKTNLTYDIRYILLAQLPTKGLEQCSNLLPRPPWEDKIRNAAIIMLLITFVLVLIAVHIDYSNIIYNRSVLYEAREKGTVHPTFNLRNIGMRSAQNNNENVPITENNIKTKSKALNGDKNDISSSVLGLKKRNLKNPKPANGEARSLPISSRSSMTLAEMVSWTFGTKNVKKSSANHRNNKMVDQSNNGSSNSTTTLGNETKSTKMKFSAKSLIDKMDGDMKKTQNSKKSKAFEKFQGRNFEKSEGEEMKLKCEETFDKELKKDKNSPKLQTKSASSSNTPQEVIAVKEREPMRTLELPSTIEITSTQMDKNQSSPKESSANGRKIGKTPGRERRKQSAQNISQVTNDITSSSSSSSTSSCSSHHNMTAKRHERKPKAKVSNSLKFITNNGKEASGVPSSSASSSPTPMSPDIFKSESMLSQLDILSPWDCGSQITFSDVLQKPQQPQQEQSISSDLMKQESLFDLTPHSHNGVENSEITAALTPKRRNETKHAVSDLGPIGTRKSPSSTPIWEPLQSAITMQLPRPLNTTSTATLTSTSSPYYPINSNFGYNELSSMSTSTLQQHQQDIRAQLLVLQRQLLEQQHLQQQQHQQQQQFLNSNVLNNNWPNISSPLWSPILGNGSTANTNNSSIFNQPQTQNSTWGITSNTSSPTNGLVRPPPGLEQSFPINNNMTSSMNQPLPSATVSSASQSVSSSSLASNFNNTIATTNTMTQSTANNNDMPMFNLFGGLNSIWNDNWKQSTNQQQQQPSQNPQ